MKKIVLFVSIIVGALPLGISPAQAQSPIKKPAGASSPAAKMPKKSPKALLIHKDEIIERLKHSQKPGSGKFGGLQRKIEEMYPKLAFEIHFAHDSAEILPESYPQLDEVARALLSPELSPYRFEIGGHTDTMGDAAYNLELSRKRAEAVKRYLLDHFPAIGAQRLVTVGYGENKPLVEPDDTPEKRARNRRVEFRRLEKMK